MDLTTRELSIIICTTAVLVWAISKVKDRSPLHNLLKTAAAPSLLGFVGLLTLYATAEVFLLHSMGLWGPSFLKTTLIWFVVTAISSGATAMTGFDDPPHWKPVVDGLQIMVLLEIIAGITTFSLPVELVLMLVVTLLAILDAVAEMQDATKPVARVCNSILAAFGLAMFSIGIGRLIKEFHTLGPGVLIEFALPPVLSLLFIPAMYCTVVYARYVWLYQKLQGMERYRSYAKWRLLRLLGFKPKIILAFGRRYAFDLPAVRSREEFDRLMRGYQSLGRAKASGDNSSTDMREAA